MYCPCINKALRFAFGVRCPVCARGAKKPEMVKKKEAVTGTRIYGPTGSLAYARGIAIWSRLWPGSLTGVKCRLHEMLPELALVVPVVQVNNVRDVD